MELLGGSGLLGFYHGLSAFNVGLAAFFMCGCVKNPH
jgi:hypothetical protein